jgi:hypothetical protein
MGRPARTSLRLGLAVIMLLVLGSGCGSGVVRAGSASSLPATTPSDRSGILPATTTAPGGTTTTTTLPPYTGPPEPTTGAVAFKPSAADVAGIVDAYVQFTGRKTP